MSSPSDAVAGVVSFDTAILACATPLGRTLVAMMGGHERPGGNVIAIIGHIDVDPTERDRLVDATVDLQRSTQSDEPGCLVYTIGADPADPGRIRITELWESAEALDAHFRHPNFFATGEAMRGAKRFGGAAKKYRIDAVADVRGADGTATSDFEQADR